MNDPSSERRQLTVMMCDMVGWTALSLRLDVEDLSEVAQAFRQRCSGIVNNHGGVIAQYVGDAVLAFFGYPRAHEDDAERALRAALAMIGSDTTHPDIAGKNIHIGIATGLVVVGGLESEHARRSTDSAGISGDRMHAIGSALNLAARLQGLAKPGTALLSDSTRRLAGAMFEYADLGVLDVKGYDEPVRGWQVVGEAKVRSRFHALRASTLTPLVGRQPELEELRRAWTSARASQGRVVILSGEPGVGKSRLTEAVARDIVGRGHPGLWFFCAQHLQGTPLAPVIRQFSVAAGFADSDDQPTRMRKLAALLPKGIDDADDVLVLLADLLSLDHRSKSPVLQMSPQRRKHRLAQAFMVILERVAARGPLLLVVEDLHWIDPSSEELIAMLVDRLSSLPVLAILTSRPDFEPHWRDGPHLLRLPLSPLGRSDSVAMVESLCADRALTQATIDHIVDQTDGLPLFIEDFTKDFFEAEGDDGVKIGEARRSGRTAFSVPTTLSDSLMARLDRLGAAKRVAQIGASIGREFSYEVLAKAVDWPQEELKEQLRRLIESGLLTRVRSTLTSGYRFKHALVRDAAYSSLLKKDQVAFHGRIAHTLVDDFPEVGETQPEVVAHHFAAAGDVDNAIPHLVKAAELAAKRSGFIEAIGHLERSLSMLRAQPTSTARIRLQLQVYLTLGGIYAEHRGFSAVECGSAYRKALELCRQLDDAPELFSVLSGVGSFEITRANFAQSRALAEECLTRAAGQTSITPFVMGHRLLGGTLFLTGELTSARTHLEQALLFYEQDQSTDHIGKTLYVQDHKSTGLCYLALSLTLLGFLDLGLRAGESSLRHSRSLGDLHAVNFSLCFLAAVNHIRRDHGEALRLATESLELAQEQGFATFVGTSQIIRGEAMASSGRREKGLEEIQSGMKAHSGMEAAAYQPFGISLYVRGLLAVQQLDEAAAAIASAIAIADKTGERFYIAELWRLKGELFLAYGRLSDAESAFRVAIDLSRQQQARLLELRSVVSLCRIVGDARRDDAVSEMLRPVMDWFGDTASGPDIDDARALLGR